MTCTTRGNERGAGPASAALSACFADVPTLNDVFEQNIMHIPAAMLPCARPLWDADTTIQRCDAQVYAQSSS